MSHFVPFEIKYCRVKLCLYNCILMNSKLLGMIVAIMASFIGTSHAALVGSLLIDGSTLPTDNTENQTYGPISSRGSSGGGNLNTRGNVVGDIHVLAGHTVGANGYNGASLSNFSFVSQYNDLNRYGGNNGGLITWDYDFSTELSGVTIGSGNGETSYKLSVDYTNRRTDTNATAAFYISVSGNGLTIDTTDIRTLTIGTGDEHVGHSTAGNSNFGQVINLETGSANGIVEADITPFIAAAQSGGGAVRLAYLESGYLGDIRIQNESGIISSINVPEPSSTLLAAFASLGLWTRRRK